MKKLLAFFMVLMTVALTGCFRADIGMNVKEDGSVDMRVKVVSYPSLRQSIYESLKKEKHQNIVPVKAGNWAGYETIDTYKSIPEMVKLTDAFKGVDAPELNMKSEGILYRSGVLYDYYVLDLFQGMPAQDNAVTHDINKVDLPGMFMTLNVPYPVDSTNAPIISPDRKTLSWDLSVDPKTRKPVPIKASFRIWHKGGIGGAVAVIAVGLLGGLFFLKKFFSASDTGEKKKAQIIAIVFLGVAVLVAAYAAVQMTGTPSLTAADRITPVVDGNGKIISQPKDYGAPGGAKQTGKPENTGKPSNTGNNVMIPGQAGNSVNAGSGPVGVITGTEVRMRQSGNINSQILGYFNKGERVTILESRDGWHRVRRADNSVGWVSGDFCKAQ